MRSPLPGSLRQSAREATWARSPTGSSTSCLASSRSPACSWGRCWASRSPPEALAARDYAGPPRLIAPTVRGMAPEGETLVLETIVLDGAPPRQIELRWRPLGSTAKATETVPLRHVARGVHRATFPPGGVPPEWIEYDVTVETASGATLRFPPTAPARGQTVAAMPQQ